VALSWARSSWFWRASRSHSACVLQTLPFDVRQPVSPMMRQIRLFGSGCAALVPGWAAGGAAKAPAGNRAMSPARAILRNMVSLSNRKTALETRTDSGRDWAARIIASNILNM
jgi:hypothetical protein